MDDLRAFAEEHEALIREELGETETMLVWVVGHLDNPRHIRQRRALMSESWVVKRRLMLPDGREALCLTQKPRWRKRVIYASDG